MTTEEVVPCPKPTQVFTPITPMVDIELVDGRAEMLPVRAHDGDAGMDCRAAHDITVHPNSAELVKLGFKIRIPHGYAGLLTSRSGHSKYRVSLANCVGVIDHQYTGEVMARIENRSFEDFIIHDGDRIAQLIVVPVLLVGVNVVEKLQETIRGEGGFGSSGIR